MDNEIKVGNYVDAYKEFTQEEVVAYNNIIKDSNPIHYDEDYAGRTAFKRPIVPGLLVTSLFGGLLGSKLPGEGTILLGHKTKFIKPVFVGEKVKAKIEIINVREDKPIITFSNICYNELGEIVVEGESVVFYKGKYFA